jgi:uncharacterized protein
MMQKILVLFHANCDDGMGAAWAAYKVLGTKGVDYIPVQYGRTPPSFYGKCVYILDFSFPPEILLDVSKNAKQVIMLDHHKSAMKDWQPLLDKNNIYTNNDNLSVKFDMNKSGAGLAWEHFSPYKQMPIMIKHIQDNDLWLREITGTTEFIRHLRTYEKDFSTWDQIEVETSGSGYLKFLSDGLTMSKFFNSQVEDLMKDPGPMPVTIREHTGLMINSGHHFKDELGHALADVARTFGMTYFFDKGNVKCSLRSPKGSLVDVSLLAKLYGGGGHATSAAMVIPINIFLKEILKYE